MTKPKQNDGVKRFLATYGESPWDTETRMCVLATEHARKVAELEAKIETLSLENFQARLKTDMHQCPVRVPLPESYWEAKYNTACKVIEKLREQRDSNIQNREAAGKAGYGFDSSGLISYFDAEIEAIERGDK